MIFYNIDYQMVNGFASWHTSECTYSFCFFCITNGYKVVLYPFVIYLIIVPLLSKGF